MALTREARHYGCMGLGLIGTILGLLIVAPGPEWSRPIPYTPDYPDYILEEQELCDYCNVAPVFSGGLCEGCDLVLSPVGGECIIIQGRLEQD